MRYSRILLLFSVLTLDAGTPAVAARELASAQSAQEQRRAELRSLLKAPRARADRDREGASDEGTASRRLSAQERSDLRQQLRQQQGGKRESP